MGYQFSFCPNEKGQKPELLTEDERLEKLSNLHDKIKEEVADASFAIGYPHQRVAALRQHRISF